jgi:hypothetical protein
MADPVAAFQGWNSSLQGWNTGTWNTNVAYNVTATASVNSQAVNIAGDAFGFVGSVVGTGAVGSVTVVGEANVSVTGVAGTSALGSFFTTNTMVTMTASVNSATTTTIGNANVAVTGISASGIVGTLTNPPWGQIVPDQDPNFLNIAPSQIPSWANIENGRVA